MEITCRKQIAFRAIQDAGEILKKNFHHTTRYKKKGKHDVVTETDIQSESLILEAINKHFPDDSIVSEETGKKDKSSDYCWYIDPLDGTANFITGNSYFAISTGLLFKNKIVFGIVYNPVTGELYSAEQGKGAFLNTRRIKASTTAQLDQSFIAIAFAPDDEKIQQGIRMLQAISTKIRRVVVNFAPSLDLCNIARGKIDGLVDYGTTPEDHAAGSLILKESGGKLQNPGFNHFDVDKTGVIASNGFIQSNLLRVCP